MNTFSIIKKVVYYTWIIAVITFGLLFVFRHKYFHPSYLSDLISGHVTHIWLAYIVVSFVRGFFLIPSTPFVLLGIFLFPGHPWAILGVSMSGVLFSATLLYYYSDNIGFSGYLEKEYPRQSAWMKKRLGGKWQFPFIYAWSIFPPVPTDLICYVTGLLKVNYWLMIAGVFLGELTLNVFYVFMGRQIVQWFYN